eukprot:gene12792-7064_t
MGIVTQIEILVTFFQYLGMTLALSFMNFPTSAKFFTIFTDGLKPLFSLINFFTLDPRAEYVVVVGLIPLLLVVVGGIPWKTAHVGIIYTIFLVLLVMMFGSIAIIKFLDVNTHSSENTKGIIPEAVLQTILYYMPYISMFLSAFGLLLVAVWTFVSAISWILIYFAEENSKERNSEASSDESDEYEKEKTKFDLISFIQRAIANVILENETTFQAIAPASISLFIILGVFIIFFACFCIYSMSYGLLTIISPIRKVGIYINDFFKQYGLKIVWIFLSLSYLPISKTVYGMLVCQQHICPNNYHLRELPFVITRTQNAFQGGYNVTKEQTCISCGVQNSSYSCPTGLYDSFCMGSSGFRLQNDPVISCDSSFFGLFIPLAMVLTIFVVIGLPMLGCYAITH